MQTTQWTTETNEHMHAKQRTHIKNEGGWRRFEPELVIFWAISRASNEDRKKIAVTQLGKLKKDGWNYWLEAKLTIYHHLPSSTIIYHQMFMTNSNETTKTRISDYRLEELDEQWKTTSAHDGIVQKQSNAIIESDGRMMKKHEHSNFIWWKKYVWRAEIHSVQVPQHGRMRLMPIKMGIATHRGQNCLGSSMREPNDVQENHYVSFSSDCGKFGCNLHSSRHMCIWISI